ncbi:MAG: DUF2723 domain-containing protein [bacterium]
MTTSLEARRPGALGPERILAGSVGLFGLVLYLVFLTPQAGWYDSGEFVGVATWFGVAHPTGYPLYSLLGRALSLLFAPIADPATRVNLLSALCGAGTLSLLTLMMYRLAGLIHLGPMPRGVRIMASVTPAAVLGTLPLFMEQAVVAEVYTLHTLAVAGLLYLALEAVELGEGPTGFYPDSRILKRVAPSWGPGGWRLPVLTAYLAGLAMGNHLTVVLYFPALAFLIWWALRPESYVPEPLKARSGPGTALRTGSILVLAGLAGLTLYLLIPIRASLHPPFNWGGASELDNFLRLVTAAEARGREAQFAPVTALNIWSRLAGGMGLPVLVLALGGWVWAGARRRRLGIAALLYIVPPLLFLLLGLDILEDALLPVHLMVSVGTGLAVLLGGEGLTSLLGPKGGGRLAGALAALLLLAGPARTGVGNAADSSATSLWGPAAYVDALSASVAGEAEPGQDVRGWVFAEDNTSAFLLWHQGRTLKRHPALHGIYLLLVREAWYRQQLRRRAPSLVIPDMPPGIEEMAHGVAAGLLIEANKGLGVPLFYSPIILPPPEVYGPLVPQGVVLRLEEQGYEPAGEDLRRHAAIMRRHAPGMQEEVPELDRLSRDWWSSRHEVLGDAWASLGALSMAEAEYRAGTRVNPGRPEPWIALADLQEGVSEWAAARQSWSQTLALHPRDSFLRYRTARAMARSGTFAAADSLLPASPPEEIETPAYLQTRAEIHRGLRRLAEAEEDLREAADMAPRDGSILNDLGVVLLVRGEREEAREVFDEATRVQPELAEAWANLGVLDFRDGRWASSEEYLQKAIEAGAANPEVGHLLGMARFNRGELEGAEAALRANMERSPRHADTYLALGAVLEARGRMQEAVSVYETGRMVAPGDDRFARELRRIRRQLPPG